MRRTRRPRRGHWRLGDAHARLAADRRHLPAQLPSNGGLLLRPRRPLPADISADLDVAGFQAALAEAKSYLAAITPAPFAGRDDISLTVILGMGMSPALPSAYPHLGAETPTKHLRQPKFRTIGSMKIGTLIGFGAVGGVAGMV